LRLLLPAVARHAWTFAGSGDFTFAAGRDPWVSIAVPRLRAAPDLATPVCAYYRATFQTLLRALVDPGITLADMACLAHGDAACIYHIGHRTLALTH
jgi:divinyl protochlorophyllide a 8-vinyl-reductase